MAKGVSNTATKNKSTDKQTEQKPNLSKAVATKKGGGLPADPELLKMMQGDAGKGVSTAMEDNIVPLLYIIQSNSPQLDRADKIKYLGKDAKAGDLWLRGTMTFVDADTENEDSGLLGVPCYFNKCWIEWKPDRGGFVARHPSRPDAAELKTEVSKESGKERTAWKMPNGNTVVETREHVFLVVDPKVNGGRPTALVVPMVSTNHTASREWMGLMNNVLLPNDTTAPSYACVYRLQTVPKKNDQGSWYGYRASHAGEEDGSAVPMFVDDLAIYRAAKKIHADFASGALKADAPDSNQTDDGEAGSGSDDM